MKELRITVTEEEHKQLLHKKRQLSWHDFIMLLAGRDPDKTGVIVIDN